jgi:hypothetical protein
MKKFAIAMSVLTLAACGGGGGGGGGDGSSTGAAEGIYEGTASASGQSTSIQVLVLEDDSFWLMYGATATEGFLQGQGVSSNGSFTSSNVKDFGVVPATSLTLSGTYSTTAHTISGSTASSNGVVSFSAGPVSSSVIYSYSTPANINTISGAWTLIALAGATVSVNISNSGAVGGISNGCQMSGTVAPRASGKNVFNLNMVAGPAPCPTPGQALSGIALAIPQQNGTTRLSIAYIDSTRTWGGAAFGTR